MKTLTRKVKFAMICCILLTLLSTIVINREYDSGIVRWKPRGIRRKYVMNRPTMSVTKVNDGIEDMNARIRSPPVTSNVDDVLPKSDVTTADPQPSNEWRDGTKVVIFARMRTGSSFVGSIFGKNPDFYYTWEPFELYPNSFKKRDRFYTYVSSVAPIMLSHLLNCRFEPLIEDMWRLYDEERITGIKGRNNTHNWRKRLCTFIPGKCPMVSSKLSSLCSHSFKHAAVKLISVQNTSTLIPLMLQDVKVISLFRDPRSILASLLKMFPNLYKDRMKWGQRSRDICADILKNLNDAQTISEQTPSVAKNLALLRFEDVAFDSKTTIEMMYKFVGLDQVPEAVWSFLNNATHKSKGNAYSLYRKSTEVPYKWIKTLSWERAKAVQNACSTVMKKLGYEVISYNRFRKAKRLFVNGSLTGQDDPKLPALKHWNIKGGINSVDNKFLPDF